MSLKGPHNQSRKVLTEQSLISPKYLLQNGLRYV